MTQSEDASKRLVILSPDEVEAIYALPQFSHEDRLTFFELTPPEETLLADLGTVTSKIIFILQLGYFKARQRLYTFNRSDVELDMRYIYQRYFATEEFPQSMVSKDTRLKHRRLILEWNGYREATPQDRIELRERAEELVRLDSQPIYILRQLFQYLEHKQIITPSYSWLRDMIGDVLLEEQKRLIHILQQQLSQDERDAINDLLTKPEGLYEITTLKRDPQHFGTKEIGREIARGEQMHPLYQLAHRVLPHFNISNESTKYYASLINYYSVFQMKQRDDALIQVYLLCFIYYRYQVYQDNLIVTLLYHVKRYLDQARLAGKDKVYEQKITYTKNLKRAGHVLELLTDEKRFTNTDVIGELRKEAHRIIEAQTLKDLAHQLTQQSTIDEPEFRWQEIDELAGSFKLRLRPLLRVFALEASAPSALQEAISFVQPIFRKHGALTQQDEANIPIDIISSQLKKYLYTKDENQQKRLLVDRYEFLIYRLMREEIEAGRLFSRHSLRYRRFEEELLSDKQWQQKQVLIQHTNLPLLKTDIETQLKQFENQLEERIKQVNERIASGENDAIKRKSSRSKRAWHLPQASLKTSINHPFFGTLPQLDIHDVLYFVDQQCQFMEAFQHILHRNRTSSADENTLIACLIAWATNTGIGRMGDISDLSSYHLRTISDAFLRPQTLREANDIVTNYIATLPIFQHYMIDTQLHSSSDGQKFETAIPTFNARYSPRYFGLKKGVVAYTLIANHVPINARVIGAHEHESHYVFDILFNNNTHVQPDIHSTDVHGINRLNFALLHLFGYQFAPRYKDIYHQFQTNFHGFKTPSEYPEHFLLKPIRKIRPDFIIPEWDHVQRLIVSLARKSTTQHTLIAKLHAFKRQHKTRRALEEYDRIIHSLYLLDYIDRLNLRHNVQRALNRGESYHQLRQAVSYANFGKLRFRSEYEQNLWQECSRLLTHVIIAYNATLLSDLLQHHLARGNEEQLQLLQRVSPVAWHHINFHGRYQFNRPPVVIDVPDLVRQLAELDIALIEE